MQRIGNDLPGYIGRLDFGAIRPQMTAMNSVAEYIIETTQSSFERDVLQGSHQHLVLVDFWAAWCAPCKALTPILENLLAQYAGQVYLAKVNTDQQQELAARYSVRSLPTVFLFRNGEAVDQFMGVQPESVIKRLLDKHVVRKSDKLLGQAITLFDSGETESAMSLLEVTVAEDPTNDRPKFTLSRWLLDSQRYDEAKAVLDSISRDGKDEMEYRTLIARLEFGLTAEPVHSTEDLIRSIEQDADNLQARLQLAHQFIQGEKLAEALDQLIEIIKRDKTFGNDAPRQTILKIFDLAGGKGELVSQYRSLLAQALN